MRFAALRPGMRKKKALVAGAARPPPHISEERRSGQQSYGFKPSEITRSSISYTQLHCSIESGTTCLSSPCDTPATPRAGRTARRFGAPLTPHLARRPLCGGRRTAVGGRPVRRGALRCGQIQFHRARGRLLSGTGPLVVIFSFNSGTLPKIGTFSMLGH